MARKRPLELIAPRPGLASLAGPDLEPGEPGAGSRRRRRPRPATVTKTRRSHEAAAEAEDTLDSVLWDVVRDEKAGRSVRAGHDASIRSPRQPITGQAVVFQTTATQRRGRDQDLPPLPEHRRARGRAQVREPRPGAVRRLQPARAARHPDRGRVVHRHLPRRCSSASSQNGQKIEIDTHSAYDVAKARDKPIDNTTLAARLRRRREPVFRRS